MRLSFFDSQTAAPNALKKEVKKLSSYQAHIAKVLELHDAAQPEYSLIHAADQGLHDTISTLVLLAGLLAGIALAFVMSQIRPVFGDREALREFTGLPLLGSVSMIWTLDQKRKSRQRTVVYAMTCFGLLCVYGAVMTANLLREEGIISKVRTLTNL